MNGKALHPDNDRADLPYFAGKENPPCISVPLKLNADHAVGRLLRRNQCVSNGK
jgi:hypothetical protein